MRGLLKTPTTSLTFLSICVTRFLSRFSILFTVLSLILRRVKDIIIYECLSVLSRRCRFFTLTTAGYLNLRCRRQLNVNVVEVIQESVVDVSHSLALHLAGGRFAA